MKAIRIHQFGAPEVMQLEEIPDPIVGAGQVLIRVYAAGANPLDTYLRSGVKIRDYTPTLPWTPGNDAAGIVEAVGDGFILRSTASWKMVYCVQSWIKKFPL